MNLYLFNPENDLALANNDPHFIPPRSARRMAADLCMLPVWWMNDRDVLPGDVADRDAAVRLWTESQGQCARPRWMDTMLAERTVKVCPWGWSPLLLTRLRSLGLSGDVLPSAQWMAVYRQSAGRQLASLWLNAFRAACGGDEAFASAGFCGESVVCTDEAGIIRSLSLWPDTMLKAPWSGSGKGLRLGRGGYVAPLTGWCRRLLSTQGAVMVEPLYDKVVDFGMEFRCDGRGTVCYEGLSLFHTNGQGAYAGNRLAAERVLMSELTRYVSSETLLRARDYLLACLRRDIAPFYEGYCGVDLMICRQDGRPVVHPCVELNLRMTMGMVSVLLSRRMAEGSEGIYKVAYTPDADALQQWHTRRLAEMPRCCGAGRIVSGYWPLTPVVPGTAYHAYMEITPRSI
ncbi:MAG: hypothetical protein NC388_07630 [Clostridium sp.]|nr:hypothetical protein [Clostridium sp.]